MATRLRATVLLAVLVLATALAAEQAGAATTLGSPDPSIAPDGYRSPSASAGTEVGLRQLALQGALLVAPEAGVLVSASAYAKRLGSGADPHIAVLRPAVGIRATIVASAPLKVTSAAGALASVTGLHLPVEPGDSVAFLFRKGQVELGVRNRPRPDGAVVSFTLPCAPCGDDAGTGSELLFDGTIEPDFDADLLGDETQDPDAGGVESFADEDGDPLFDEGFGEQPFDEDEPPGATRPKRLRLIKATPRRDGGVNLLLAAPKAGRLSAIASVAAARPKREDARRTAAGTRVTIASARTRVKQARRVRLELIPSRAGRRLLERRGPLPALISVTFRAATRKPQTLSKPLKLSALPTRRDAGKPSSHSGLPPR